MISLLRGVNLGPSKRLRMDELREVYAAAGMQCVQTYVQSGNVVFKTASRDLGKLASRLEDAVEARFGFRAAVVLRSLAEIQDVIARNPFAGRPGIEGSKLLVVFLQAGATPAAVSRMNDGPEEVHVSGREIYIYFPEGQGRSRLFGTVDKVLRGQTTARNWNTVTKLAEIGSALL